MACTDLESIMQPGGLDSIVELEKLMMAQAGGLAMPAHQSMIISCPKKMVGRVIGKNGETIKALQQFTGAQIQIDQRSDPTRVSIAGAPKAMQMATSMVQDIVAGTFKGFAMLRSYATQAMKSPGALELLGQPAPVYVEGYGFIPPSQFSDVGDNSFGYPQLHPYNNDQLTSQASLSALSQLYGLQNKSDVSMMMQNAPQQYNGLDTSSQQAHMASLARSLFDSSELKTSNGMHHGPLLNSQADHSTAGYPPLSLGLNGWSQPLPHAPEEAPKGLSARQSVDQLCSRDPSPSITEASRPSASAPQDPSTLAAQLHALSLLSNYHDKPRASSDTSQHSVKWAGGSNGTSSPPAPSLPEGWMQLTDPEKRVLYHNYITGHTQYTLPTSQGPIDQGLGTSAALTEAEASAGLPSLGHRSSMPLVASGKGEDSLTGTLRPRMSGPAAFNGSLSQRAHASEALAAVTEALSSSLDSQFQGMSQHTQEPEFKIGNRLPPTGLFQ